MKVLIAGASGLLGSNLTPHLKSLGHKVEGLSRGGHAGLACDLCDKALSFKLLDATAPDAIINLVALSDIDECEANPNKAFLLNCRTAETLAAWHKASPKKPRVIHISTDHVYDSQGPHKENAASPANTYSITKFKAECVMAASGATVIRTNFFGMSKFSPARGFLAALIESLKNDERPEISFEALFNPLYIPTLAGIIARILDNPKPGVFNVGSKDGFSKGQFAVELAKGLGFNCTPARPKRDSSETRTPRPRDMRMDCSLFEGTFGIPLPKLEDEITKALAELKAK